MTDELREAFGVFDTNGDGYLSRDEFMFVLTQLGDGRLTEAKADAWLQMYDSDHDGLIDMDEFVTMFAPNSLYQNISRLKEAWSEGMRRKAPGSWSPDDFPPCNLGAPFGGGPDAKIVGVIDDMLDAFIGIRDIELSQSIYDYAKKAEDADVFAGELDKHLSDFEFPDDFVLDVFDMVNGAPDDAKVALAFAETHGLLAGILAARDQIVIALYGLQLAVCTACGDSRTHLQKSAGWHASISKWRMANTPSDPGYELSMVVIDAIKALQRCEAVGALGELVTKLATAVYGDIPQGVGYVEAKVEELNTHPTQQLGFQVGGFLAGKDNNDVIPMADCSGEYRCEWTAEMKDEIEAAVAKLKAGEQGDPAKFSANGRDDLFMIMNAIYDEEIIPLRYLIVLAINRAKTFHAKAMQVALAACGGDGSSYSAGPLKTDERVNAKCAPGGDYWSEDPADYPNCKLVMDEIRGSVRCKSHAEMERGHVEARKVFGAPAVVKDRRAKVQRDMLFVFKHEGMFVELQFHFVDTLAVKVLAHAVFEIQRLNTDDGSVTCSGLNTVMVVPPTFDHSAAKDVKLLLHI